jgi:crotonobetainyl-CoA:carnitine CoA-transferase CaiB-like acyl-CoA transferase
VIYCSISGFGATQAPGTGKAMDNIIQALSGLMMTSGSPEDPPVRVGVPVADLVAPVFGVVGILAALRQREASGSGQHVDVSMLGVLTSLVAAEPFDLLEACGLPQRTGRVVPRLTPFGIYESSDGHVAICAPTEQFARGVFAAIGHPEFQHDPRFATRDARVAHVDEMNAHIETFTRTLSTAALLPLLARHHVPAADVRSPRDAVRDPRVLARGETVPLEHPEFGPVADVVGMGIPITFSDARAGSMRPAPSVGQDNALVYGDWLGYGRSGVDQLQAAGII